jgi:uncharacterized protein involved in propanediol utilization
MKTTGTYRNGHPRAAREAEFEFQVGYGRGIAQFGELFQGQITDQHNRRRRCLLSLPCKELFSEATFQPQPGNDLIVHPSHKQKAKKTAELVLAHFGASSVKGLLTITSNIPEGKGCGSSTADCVAAGMAVCNVLGKQLSEEEIAYLVVRAEIASDNLMFNRAVLFAHREGVVLEDYAKGLPKLEVLGIDTADDEIVNTLEFPPAVYSPQQIELFHTLTGMLKRAIRDNDSRLLGEIATTSASINDSFLPKPLFSQIRGLAESAGAIGVSVAHSGTVLSILFNPVDPLLERHMDQLKEGLNKLGISKSLRFQT